MPLSSDPTARARQLANLRSSEPSNATTHGAHSEPLIRPLAEEYLDELAGEFPSASERVLRVQARRLAKLDRLGVYLDGRGEIRHKRRGEVFPASALEEQISAAYLAEHRRLEAHEREAGAGSAGETLESIARELSEGEHGGGAEEVGVEAQREAGGGETLASIAAELAAEGDDDDVVGTDVELPDVDGGDGDG